MSKQYLTWGDLKTIIAKMDEKTLSRPIVVTTADNEDFVLPAVATMEFDDCGHDLTALVVNTNAEEGPVYMKGVVHEQS